MADHAVTGHVVRMLVCFVCTPAQICCCIHWHNKMSWHQRGRYLNVTFCASLYNLSNRSSPHTMPAARPALSCFATHTIQQYLREGSPSCLFARQPKLYCSTIFSFRVFFLSWINATVNQSELTANSFELMSSPLAPLNVTSLPCVPSSRDRTRGGAARRRGSIVAAKTRWVCLGLSTMYDQAPWTMKQSTGSVFQPARCRYRPKILRHCASCFVRDHAVQKNKIDLLSALASKPLQAEFYTR